MVHVLFLAINYGLGVALALELPLHKSLVLVGSSKTLPMALSVLTFLPKEHADNGILAIPMLIAHIGQVSLSLLSLSLSLSLSLPPSLPPSNPPIHSPTHPPSLPPSPLPPSLPPCLDKEPTQNTRTHGLSGRGSGEAGERGSGG
jgi:hypothetical protein